MHVMAKASGLWNPQIMFLEQPPGKFIRGIEIVTTTIGETLLKLAMMLK